MFTRDSPFWNTLLALGSVALALSALTNPEEYGIPLHIMPYLKLGALIATIIGGKFSTSPRPHSEEGDAKITMSGR